MYIHPLIQFKTKRDIEYDKLERSSCLLKIRHLVRQEGNF